jgi:hypothetical protein
MIDQTSRVPGPALIFARISAGTVVCPLAVRVEVLITRSFPYIWPNCNAHTAPKPAENPGNLEEDANPSPVCFERQA